MSRAKLKGLTRAASKRTSTSLGVTTRYGVMNILKSQYATRFHMFLVVTTAIAVALLVTRGLLLLGITTMWVRYSLALVAAYGTFFIGVWIWLHLSQYGRHLRAQKRESTFDANIDLPSGGRTSDGQSTSNFQGGGGGSSDGGGASGGWDEGVSPVDHGISVDAPSGANLDALVPNIDVDLGGDESGCLIVIAVFLLVAFLTVIFGAAGYVIYQAPAILAEVVFEVLLGSRLARGARAVDSASWSRTLLAVTWKPFAIVSLMALCFAVYCQHTFPGLATAGEVLHAAIGRYLGFF